MLVRAIVSYVADRDEPVTRTKLLKLLFLFDLEYYRAHRRTFTGFSWKYLHFGPWAREFDESLQGMVARQVLSEQESSRYGTKFYRTTERLDADRTFPDLGDYRILRGILRTWGEAKTPQILDYVYFHTEPMIHGVRNEPLDFSVVPQNPPQRYARSSSGKSPEEIGRLRKALRERAASEATAPAFEYTPPRYDEDFFEAVELLDGM
jgi:hypothetical protein